MVNDRGAVGRWRETYKYPEKRLRQVGWEETRISCNDSDGAYVRSGPCLRLEHHQLIIRTHRTDWCTE